LTSNCDVREWAPALLGAGADFALDTEADFVVCANFLGSPYGSSSPLSARLAAAAAAAADGGDPSAAAAAAAAFPGPITVADNVRAQHALLQALGVRQLAAAVGGSLGAMLALEYAATHPERVRSLALIAGAASATAWSVGANAAQRAAIAADARWNGGAYEAGAPPVAGLVAARAAAMLTYRAPAGLQQRFAAAPEAGGAPLRRAPAGAGADDASATPQRWSVESWLDHAGASLVSRFDAGCYVSLTHTLDSHHVAPERLARIACPALVVGVSSDTLYPMEQAASLAEGLPRGELAVLHSPHGHDGFLIQAAEVGARVRDFRRALRRHGAQPPPLPAQRAPERAPAAARPVYADAPLAGTGAGANPF
jgi:homoserine O-acetyltransferase